MERLNRQQIENVSQNELSDFSGGYILNFKTVYMYIICIILKLFDCLKGFSFEVFFAIFQISF